MYVLIHLNKHILFINYYYINKLLFKHNISILFSDIEK